MGNEVSVYAPDCFGRVKELGDERSRSVLRVWVVDETTVSLPEIPEAEFPTAAGKLSARAVYIIRHDYEDNGNAEACAVPEDYIPLSPVVLDPLKLSEILKQACECIESSTLMEPLETTSGMELEPVERLRATYLWVGKEATPILQANALSTAMNISRHPPECAQGFMPITYFLKQDVPKKLDESSLPPVNETFTFADQERVRKSREAQASYVAEMAGLLQMNRLARELYTWEGMAFVPRQETSTSAGFQGAQAPSGDEESVKRRREELYELFTDIQ